MRTVRGLERKCSKNTSDSFIKSKYSIPSTRGEFGSSGNIYNNGVLYFYLIFDYVLVLFNVTGSVRANY